MALYGISAEAQTTPVRIMAVLRGRRNINRILKER